MLNRRSTQRNVPSLSAKLNSIVKKIFDESELNKWTQASLNVNVIENLQFVITRDVYENKMQYLIKGNIWKEIKTCCK